METIIIFCFVIGYFFITIEHSTKIDKLIPALVMMATMWAVVSLGMSNFTQWFDSSNHSLIEGFQGLDQDTKMHYLEDTLLHHLGKTAEILVFLLGAMTIVEIIDYFDGFSTFKKAIRSRKKKSLLWVFTFLAFFLSAIIDNLTATIVLITILQKIIKSRETRIWFVGLIVIAANAGGAWSPIGDVTTTMLWIGEKVTTGKLFSYLFVPSLVCMMVPTLIASFLSPFKGDVEQDADTGKIQSKFSSWMLYIGLAGIISVPIFKTVTHLPPYIGMMLALGIVAVCAEIFSNSKFSISSLSNSQETHAQEHQSPVHRSLSKIELPSILFFLGILMAVAALESLGTLFNFAGTLNETVPKLGTEITQARTSDLTIILLGIGSAVIDNVPLVAASLGMFSESVDNQLWHFIAYSAGTGGSMLIIGSAAGVVAMGMEKIDFFWYLKKISMLAFLGFIAGALCFMGTRLFF